MVAAVVFAQDVSPAAQPTNQSQDDAVTVQIVNQVDANYPQKAIQHGLQGEVVVNVAISLSGDVETVNVISGDPVLVQSSVEAAKQWKFRAWQYMDLPIRAWAKLAFDFHLQDPASSTPRVTERVVESGGTGDPVWVSPLVVQGMLIKQVAPQYPKYARRRKIQGTVTLEAIISKEGTVENLEVESGPQELVGSAEDAVRQWKFKPYLLMGQPIRVRGKMIANFVLR